MSTDLVIARLGSALAALGEAKTIQDTKAILDVATAAEIYAKRQKMSEESIAFAHDVKTEALRQLGELLKASPKNAGAATPNAVPKQNRVATLAEQGIDKKTSMTAQRLADLPPEKFQAVKSGEMSLAKATAKPPAVHVAKGTAPKAATHEPDEPPMVDEDDPEADEAIAREQEEVERGRAKLAEILLGDDPLSAMTKRCDELVVLNGVLNSRIAGLQREVQARMQDAKSWMRKAKALEKSAK